MSLRRISHEGCPCEGFPQRISLRRISHEGCPCEGFPQRISLRRISREGSPAKDILRGDPSRNILEHREILREDILRGNPLRKSFVRTSRPRISSRWYCRCISTKEIHGALVHEGMIPNTSCSHSTYKSMSIIQVISKFCSQYRKCSL